jgi:hypothetical protein
MMLAKERNRKLKHDTAAALNQINRPHPTHAQNDK